jgi:hypothetical protein
VNIGEYNWHAWSHEDLHAMINGRGAGVVGILKGTTGRGPAGGVGAVEAWSRFTDLMTDLRQRTAEALARAGVSWEGQAAEAAWSGITPLERWADDAHAAGTATVGGTTALVDCYSKARNAMPEPIPTASSANSDFLGIPAGFTHLLGGQTDQDRQERAAYEAKLEAVRVLNSYRATSAGTTAALGVFVPPPKVVAELAITSGDVPSTDQPQRYVPSTTTPANTPSSTTPSSTVPPATPSATTTEHPLPAPPPSAETTRSSGVPTARTAPPPSPTPEIRVTTSAQHADTTAPSTASTTGGPVPHPLTGPGVRPNPTTGERVLTGSGTADRPGTGRAVGGETASRPGSPVARPDAVPRGGGSPSARMAPAPVQSTPHGQAGFAAPPVGQARAEDDVEHFGPEYLNGSHDEFWAVDPDGRVAPPVIGE